MALTSFLKQNTAVTVTVGPFVDETDGKTAETALTISQADVRVSKNDGTFAQKNDTAAAVHKELGYYSVALDATDTNTLGVLTVAIHESGALPVRQDYMVVPANVWDSLFGSDRLQVDVQEMGTDVITATAFHANAWDELIAALQAKTDVGVFQSATSNTATLASDAAGVDDTYNGCILIAISPSGSAQATLITDYVGATKVASISPNWVTTPDATYRYVLVSQ